MDPTPEATAPPARAGLRIAALAALLIAAAWLGALGLRGLFAPDEGRYAEIPREMLASGDWVTPRMNDLKYFEKPPLQYWATAVAYSLLGEHEWSARLWPALTGLAAALAAAWSAARVFSPRAGLIAGVVLATSWAYVLAGQYLTLDMSLTGLLGIALALFVAAQHDGADARLRRRAMLGAWACVALALLTKGLVALVLPGLALVAYVVVQRDPGLLLRLHLGRGLLVMLAITLPWFAMVQSRNPEFFQFFFIEEHFRRFTVPGHNRPGPWWYFIPVGVLGLLPWTAAALVALVRAAKPGPGAAASASPSGAPGAVAVFRPDRFLLVWALAIFVFFSISRSKLPAYVLPAFPALAMLAGLELSRAGRRVQYACAASMLLVGFVLLGLLPQLQGWRKFGAVAAELDAADNWLWAAVAVVALGGAAMAVAVRACRPGAAVAAGAVASLLAWLLAYGFMDRVADGYSSQRLVQERMGVSASQRPFAPGVPFYSVDVFDHTLPFYLGRTLTMVEYKGELAPGVASEPAKFVPSIAEFERLWRDLPRGYAVMRPEMHRRLAARGVAMKEVARDLRLVVVSRP